MPDPYNLSAGHVIGTPVQYSPRSSTALRKLKSVDGADLYGDPNSDEARLAGEYLSAPENADLVQTRKHRASGSATINGQTYIMGPGGSARLQDDMDRAGMNDNSYTWQERPRYNAADLAKSSSMKEWLARKARADEAALAQTAADKEDERSLKRMAATMDMQSKTPQGKVSAALAALEEKKLAMQISMMEQDAADRANPGVFKKQGTLLNVPRASELYDEHISTGMSPRQALAQASRDAREESIQVQRELAALAQRARLGDMLASAEYSARLDSAKKKYGTMLEAPSQDVRATVSAAISNDRELASLFNLARSQANAFEAADIDATDNNQWYNYTSNKELNAQKKTFEEAKNTLVDLAEQVAQRSGHDVNEVYAYLRSRMGATASGSKLFAQITGGR